MVNDWSRSYFSLILQVAICFSDLVKELVISYPVVCITLSMKSYHLFSPNYAPGAVQSILIHLLINPHSSSGKYS